MGFVQVEIDQIGQWIFLGIDDVEFVYAEGLAIGPERKAAALSQAQRAIERLAAPEALAA